MNNTYSRKNSQSGALWAQVIVFAAALFFTVPAPAAFAACSLTEGGGQLCGASQNYCANASSCLAAPTCTNGKDWDCNTCNGGGFYCLCPAAAPNDCTGGGGTGLGTCQVSNNGCAATNQEQVCTSSSSAGTTMSCGGCLAGHVDCDAGTGYDCRFGTLPTACLAAVYLSQSTAQNGYINITGDLTAGGHLTLNNASAGNINLKNGKAIVVAGASTTTFSIGNDFTAGTSANLYVFGSSFTRDTMAVTNGSHSVGFKAPTLTASTAWTLPANDGVAGQFLQTDGLNNLTWAGGGSTDAFVNGGNSFAEPAILGTNDPYALALKTNGTVQMTIDANGRVGIGTAGPAAKVDVVHSTATLGENGTGIKVVTTDTSADSSGSNFAYGIDASVIRNGATGGSTTVYGGSFSANAFGSSGTVNAYGSRSVSNSAPTTYGAYGSSNGTTTAYGLYGNGYGLATSYGSYATATGATAVGAQGTASGSSTSYGVLGTSTGGGTTGYGGYFASTGLATNKYGIFATVTPGATSYAGVFTNGNVGIGTVAPLTQLHIQHATSGPVVSLSGLDTNYRGISIKNTLNQEKWFVGNNDSNNFIVRRAGLSDPLTVDAGTGNIGIGDATPVSLLTVGTADAFQVNVSGDIVSLKGVPYVWPAAQGAAGTALVNDGAGMLSWSSVSTNACSTTRKFAGVTTGAYTGNLTGSPTPRGGLTGYRGADDVCDQTFPGSKVCSADEVINSYRCQTSPAGIYGASGFAWLNAGPPGDVANQNDCNGWTNATGGPAGYLGRIWNFTASGGNGTGMACDASNKYACCL